MSGLAEDQLGWIGVDAHASCIRWAVFRGESIREVSQRCFLGFLLRKG